MTRIKANVETILVAIVALIAAYVSYWHLQATVASGGEHNTISTYLIPFTPDAMMAVAALKLRKLPPAQRTWRKAWIHKLSMLAGVAMSAAGQIHTANLHDGWSIGVHVAPTLVLLLTVEMMWHKSATTSRSQSQRKPSKSSGKKPVLKSVA